MKIAISDPVSMQQIIPTYKGKQSYDYNAPIAVPLSETMVSKIAA